MENKNTGLIILVVVLSLLVLGLGGFIVYDKLLSSSNETTNNEQSLDNSIDKETQDDKNSQDKNVNENIVVNDFVYDRWVNTVYKDLVGKYVSTETTDTFFEIDTTGKVSVSVAGCSGEEATKYSNEDVEFKYYYTTPEEGISTVHILVTSKIGSSKILHQFMVNLEYNVNSNTFDNFSSLPIGCTNKEYTQYKKQ